MIRCINEEKIIHWFQYSKVYCSEKCFIAAKEIRSLANGHEMEWDIRNSQQKYKKKKLYNVLVSEEKRRAWGRLARGLSTSPSSTSCVRLSAKRNFRLWCKIRSWSRSCATKYVCTYKRPRNVYWLSRGSVLMNSYRRENVFIRDIQIWCFFSKNKN